MATKIKTKESTRKHCFPEEAILARLLPNPFEDLPRAIRDIQFEEQRIYDDWRENGELAPYCHGCSRISECYSESGFEIRGLRHYKQQ